MAGLPAPPWPRPLCLERSRRAPALWWRGEVQLDRLSAGTRARLDGKLCGGGLEDQRRDLLGAVDADPGAEQPAARAVAIRLVRCQSEALAHDASTLAARRPWLSHDAADNYAFGKHVIIVVTPLRREAAARLRTNWSPCQCQWFQTISRAATPPSTKKTEPKTR